MIFFLIRQTIISILVIISVHYIYMFFKSNLTIPKTIDLINKPKNKYHEIYDSIKKKSVKTDDDMKDNLKSYLKELTSKSNTKIDYFNNSNNFSNYN